MIACVGRLMRDVLVAAFLVYRAAGLATAQNSLGENFGGRLSPIPITAQTAPTTKGLGSLSARLTEHTLTISGHFEGLNAPATGAQVRVAMKGLRGPALFSLRVINNDAGSGTITGQLKLSPAQLVQFRREQFYVQLDSTANPDGHL